MAPHPCSPSSGQLLLKLRSEIRTSQNIHTPLPLPQTEPNSPNFQPAPTSQSKATAGERLSLLLGAGSSCKGSGCGQAALPASGFIPEARAHRRRQARKRRGQPVLSTSLVPARPGHKLFAGGIKDPEDGGKRTDSLGERLGTDFGPWRFPCVSFSILGWLLLVREFSASRGKPSEAGAGSAWLLRALPPPWVPSSPQARGTPRVGTLAHPHGGQPFPGSRVPPRMFPSCNPTGLLDLGPRKQAAGCRRETLATTQARPWEPDRGRLEG